MHCHRNLCHRNLCITSHIEASRTENMMEQCIIPFYKAQTKLVEKAVNLEMKLDSLGRRID